jgi:hypothetical protein
MPLRVPHLLQEFHDVVWKWVVAIDKAQVTKDGEGSLEEPQSPEKVQLLLALLVHLYVQLSV